MFSVDHPLQFTPVLRSYLWGGAKLERILGKKTPENRVWAESWEVVDHREAQSVVANGPLQGQTLRQLLELFSEEIMGYDAKGAQFPLLFKYLDCQLDLSVQVHPDDLYGSKMVVPDNGKTEAWYVIDAEPGAKLYAGLKTGVGAEEVRNAIKNGTLESLLHVIPAKAGDCIFIPAGTVHALGAGLLIAEIQQASDCTFRLYDWSRVDAEGKSRELHIEQGLEVIDFERGPVTLSQRKELEGGWTELVACDKFTLLETKATHWIDLPRGQASILTIPAGAAEVIWTNGAVKLSQGTTLLVPVACDHPRLQLEPGSTALLSIVPSQAPAESH